MSEPRLKAAKPGSAKADSIVRAAFEVLANQGSHAASIKEIAKAAGVAPGLVHYYFATKEALIVEVVRSCCEQFRVDMASVELPADPVERTRLLFAWSRERAMAQSGWYKVLTDLTAMSLRDPALAQELAQLTREMRAHLAGLVLGVTSSLNEPLPVGAEGLAAVLMAASDGLVVRSMIDPTLDADGAHAVLEALVIGLLTR